MKPLFTIALAALLMGCGKDSKIVSCAECGMAVMQSTAVKVPAHEWFNRDRVSDRFFCTPHAPKCDYIQDEVVGGPQYFNNPKPFRVNRDGTRADPPAVIHHTNETQHTVVRYRWTVEYITNHIVGPPTITITKEGPCEKAHVPDHKWQWNGPQIFTNIAITNFLLPLDTIIITNGVLTNRINWP